jgi:DNA-binding PadR family transcriptional regulator
MLGYLHEASFGSIYPALTRLEQEGLATAVAMPQEKRPDKKVYSLTAAGRAALTAALMTPPAPDKMRSDFLFILVLGDLLPREHLRRLIDLRIAWYRDCIQHMERCDPSSRPATVQLVNGLGLAVYRAAAEYLESNRHLVDGSRQDGDPQDSRRTPFQAVVVE